MYHSNCLGTVSINQLFKNFQKFYPKCTKAIVLEQLFK